MDDLLCSKSGAGTQGCFDGLDELPCQIDAAEGMKYWIPENLGVTSDGDIQNVGYEYQTVMDRDLDASGVSFYSGHGNGGSDTIHRLREGVERFMVTDINNPAATAMAQSTLPIMWDYVSVNVEEFSHIPGGSNVLFLDGHTEFKKYPGNDFPVHKAYAHFSVGYFMNCYE